VASSESNKEAVGRLFEAFRAGNTDAFDELIVEDYVQHNPQADNGLQAVKDFFAPVGPVDVEVHRVIAEGDLVAVHSHYRTWNQEVPETTASGNDMFSQLS
jgi:predicted SnoaL-like aldol condensation-catalyzing enzyme